MTQLNPIRVLLVDDHMVYAAIKHVLSVFDDLKLVGEAGDGERLSGSVNACSRM